jgi:hypothetical protein
MTKDEKFKIIQESLAAANRGDEAEEERLLRKLPLAPHLALALKDIISPEELTQAGYDFSEVEAKYGKNWLIT